MPGTKVSARRRDRRSAHFLSLLVPLLVVLLAARAQAQKPPRYVGLMASGQQIAGESLADWHTKEALPRLDNQPLLDAANPFKWLRDRSLPLTAAPAAFVETHTGDVLPGTVVDARTGQELPFDPLPAHLLVEPAVELAPPGKPPSTTIRVAAASLRRVVWQRRSRQTYEPGNVFLRDGRSLSFRALRFGPGSVSVLLESGTQRLSWNDLAEIHLPRVEFWPAYFDDLAGSCASAASRVLQLETASGLVATSSLDRFVPRFDGNPQDSSRWVHGIQPAWSLDILWIPCRDIAVRRLFAAHQVPLSRVEPARILSQSLLAGTGKPPRVNRSVLGGPLQSARLEFGWGFGVHARSELTFELPEGIKSLRTQAAIDRSSGSGGCVRMRVFSGSNRSLLWESPLLVGSEAVADCGALPLAGPKGGQTHIVLEVDPAHEGRPAGADPLDIRDAVNWLDPLLELDPVFVQGELDRRLTDRFLAWQGGSVRLSAGPSEPPVPVSFARNEHLPAPGRFDTLIGHASRSIEIDKTLTLQPQDQWLVLAAVKRQDGSKAPRLEIQIGGEPVAQYDPPPTQNDPNEVRPLAISLAPYQRPGGTIRVTVRQLPAENAVPLHWRTFQVAPQLPTLYRIYEDEPAADASLSVVDDERHYGTRSIRVASGRSVELPLSGPVAIRERPQWGEYRFLRFAVRKRGQGRIGLEMATGTPRNDPPRYDAGKGDPALEKALRIWNDELPDQWIVLTRDLYADFGSTELTRLSLHCPDGEAAWFDHLYLARNPDDFRLIPEAPSPEQTNQKARQELAAKLIEQTRPTLVALQLPDGSVAGGLVISREGEVLTTGHWLKAAGQDVNIRLADGRTAKGRSLGISRELDLGLVKITDEGKWPVGSIDNHQEVNLPAAHVALVFPGNAAVDSVPQVHVAMLRRSFQQTLWVDADGEAFTPGGVLITPRGQAVGLHSRRSQFGGFLFSRLHWGELQPHLERMRRSEIYGTWPAGSEPLLGCEGIPASGGLEVTRLDDGGPAAKAGLQRGDVVVRIGGKPIAVQDDLSLALRETDSGQQVAIEILRGGAPLTITAALAPRSP